MALARYVYIYFFILLFSALVDSKSFFTIISVIGAIIGILIFIINGKAYLGEIKNNRFLYVGLGLLLPIIIASIDSPDFSKSFAVFTKMLPYLLMGSLAIYMLKAYETYSRLIQVTAIFLIFISLDAILQWQTGYHVLGHKPVIGNRVVGIFGDHRYILSYFLGTFAPVFLFALYAFFESRRGILRLCLCFLALSVFVTAIVIGGARAGMVSFIVSLFLFTCYLFIKVEMKHKALFFIAILFTIAIVIFLLSQTELVQNRFTTTLRNFGTEKFWETFSAGRTNIWHVAVNEISNHWLNGMGPRAFNYFYQMYPEDFKRFPLVWHTHLHGLEVLIETGLIGFIPYILICLYLLMRMFTAKEGNMWLMMGFVAIMPINSHVGLYQDYLWIPIFWVPILLGLTQAYYADKQLVK